MRKPNESHSDESWPDQRLLEFIGAIAVIVLIAVGVRYIDHAPRTDTAAFIVPSQSVRW